MSKKYAVVDIGTLKVKVLIAEVEEKLKLKPVYISANLTCFGCRMEERGGVIVEENLIRTIDELTRVRDLIKKHHVNKSLIVSTHALRRAVNKEDIIKRIKREVGFDVINISQEDEAKYFYYGAMKTFTDDREYALVDVGGGSVQVLIGTPKKLRESHLLKIGAQYLHETFTKDCHNPDSKTTAADVDKIKKFVSKEFSVIKKQKNIPIIYGSTMVISVMKQIGLPFGRHEFSDTHPHKIKLVDMRKFLGEILKYTYARREKLYPECPHGYVWGIDKAFVTILTLAEKLDSPYVIPSNANIADGLIYSLIHK